MQIISELEEYRRGPYAGAVLLLAAGRAARHVHRDPHGRPARRRRACLQAGAGIVADSDPQAEHEECLRKLAALETAIDLAEARHDDPALIDNYDSFTYNLAHLFGELGAEVVVRRNDEITRRRGGASSRPPTS